MIDVRLDRDIEVGAKARPRYSTDIVTTDGGFEFRNSRWAFPLFEFQIDLEPGALVDGVYVENETFDAAFEAALDLFHAAGGTADTFRFRHWRDYQGVAQTILPLNGSTTDYQLYRNYTRGAVTRLRKITRPVDGTVVVYVNGAPVSATVDYTTGIVTIADPGSDPVTADFEFDVPVRFADDQLEIASLSDDLDQISTITLQEVRE